MGFFKSFFSGKQEKPETEKQKTIKRTSRYSSMTACVHNAWGVPIMQSNASRKPSPFRKTLKP